MIHGQGVSGSRNTGERNDLEGAVAVVAAETGLVVDAVVGGELVDQVDRLLARCALLVCSRERHPLSRSRGSS